MDAPRIESKFFPPNTTTGLPYGWVLLTVGAKPCSMDIRYYAEDNDYRAGLVQMEADLVAAIEVVKVAMSHLPAVVEVEPSA